MTSEVENTDGQRQRRGFQFTFRHIMAVFLALSGVLALCTQFRHVGCAVSCFLLITVLGWWLGKRRWMFAGLTAFSVFVITLGACWVQIGQSRVMDRSPNELTRHALAGVDEALSSYFEQREEYPQTLDELVTSGQYSLYVDPSGRLLDGWRKPLHYQRTLAGFQLMSFGRDGVRGGVGLDADITWTEAQTVGMHRLPLRQFLFETRGSASVFFVAVLTSIAAAFTWHGVDQDLGLTTGWRLLGVLVTTISAAAVAVFLAAFHVAASQSGH